jgi:hypothetical protein
MSEGKGHCLCGAVKFTVKAMNNSVDACHCGMCRRWGGGPLMSISCGKDVTFKGEENITVYDSSDWAERGFCKLCGSHLFYRLKDAADHQLSAGLFESQKNFHFDLQVFTDRKPAFYNFANITKEMTEAEVIEKFAPEQNT